MGQWSNMTEEQKERVGERSRKWREANQDKEREYRRKWRAANPEKERESSRKWREANPEKAKNSDMKSDAMRRQQKLFNSATQCAESIAQLANKRN